MTHRLSVHNPRSLNHRHRPCHTHHLPPRSIEAGGPPEQRGIARQRGHFRLDPQLKPPPCPATSNRDDGTKRAGQGSPTGCEPRHPSDGRTRGSSALNARCPTTPPWNRVENPAGAIAIPGHGAPHGHGPGRRGPSLLPPPRLAAAAAPLLTCPFVRLRGGGARGLLRLLALPIAADDGSSAYPSPSCMDREL